MTEGTILEWQAVNRIYRGAIEDYTINGTTLQIVRLKSGKAMPLKDIIMSKSLRVIE